MPTPVPSCTRLVGRLSVFVETGHFRCLHCPGSLRRWRSATSNQLAGGHAKLQSWRHENGFSLQTYLPLDSRPPGIHKARITSNTLYMHSTSHIQVTSNPVQNRPPVQPLVPPTITMEPIVHTVFESQTSTWQYIVADPSTKTAVIIDPVLDFDPARNAISTKSADALLALAKEEGYIVDYLLETHAHADHLTAAKYLQSRLSKEGKKPDIGIGKRIAGVQERFAKRYGIAREEYEGAFDKLLEDDEIFHVGELEAKAVHLPGHTPDHMGYLIGKNIFCGDSIFNSDVGSARCDFPGGDANDLYQTATKLFTLPPAFKIYTGHDYPPKTPRTAPQASSTVAEQMTQNKHLKSGTSEADFVSWRTERDAGLAEPRLMHQALQVNIRAGKLPGDGLLHVPVKVEGW
ncbi:beta-lactamase-like protein [Chaetomium fimeti]|uniref:Beta-lactamase-like protein n=1 Tax=Chaetomium fimeti TaxID=1854472 RepID=A0AAE0LR98_9PEZI|nr:beta-lactamase-like protein [Chaetomium fimeti]